MAAHVCPWLFDAPARRGSPDHTFNSQTDEIRHAGEASRSLIGRKLVFRRCPFSLYAIRFCDQSDFFNDRETIMRSMIKLLIVLVICLVGIGFWRGWFSLSSSPDPNMDGDKVKVGVSVDKGKMKSDVRKAEEKVKEEVSKLEGKMRATETK